MRTDISKASFTNYVRREIQSSKAKGQLKDTETLTTRLRKFEELGSATVYDTYEAGDKELRKFIDSRKDAVAKTDPKYLEKRLETLKSIDSKMCQLLQSAVPGDLSRLTAVEALGLLQDKQVTELEYDGALAEAKDRKLLKESKGETLQDIYAEKEAAATSKSRFPLKPLVVLGAAAAGLVIGSIVGGVLGVSVDGLLFSAASGAVFLGAAGGIQADHMNWKLERKAQEQRNQAAAVNEVAGRIASFKVSSDYDLGSCQS